MVTVFVYAGAAGLGGCVVLIACSTCRRSRKRRIGADYAADDPFGAKSGPQRRLALTDDDLKRTRGGRAGWASQGGRRPAQVLPWSRDSKLGLEPEQPADADSDDGPSPVFSYEDDPAGAPLRARRPS